MNLKETGKVLTSKSVGTGPSSYEKRIYRAAGGLTKVEKHSSRALPPHQPARCTEVMLICVR